ncbi:MAG: SagB/ThcOx family dehydrogenase [Candidatus Thorarchaeota archaeon]
MDEESHNLKSPTREEMAPAIKSDMQKGILMPPFQKKIPDNATLIALTPPDDFQFKQPPFLEVINKRASHRRFTKASLTIEELSFLLWCTQGVKRVFKNGFMTFKTVPSAGGRHPFETYLVLNRVEGINRGLYRYIPHGHKLLYIKSLESESENLAEILFNRAHIINAPVIFFWTVIPYRTVWKYKNLAYKMISIEIGMICQNLYLASEAIGCGTCGTEIYIQDHADEFLGVDGEDEFTVFLAPVGKPAEKLEISNFLSNPQNNVDLNKLERLEGKYSGAIELDIKIKDESLFLIKNSDEIALKIHNETEFTSEWNTALQILAVKFLLDDEGKPTRMEVLTINGLSFSFNYVE